MTNKIPKIYLIARDAGGCGFYRIQQPANFIKKAGLADIEVALNRPNNLNDLLSADLVVMQEMGSVNASEIANFLIKNKVPYIAECDDYLHHVSPHNTAGYGAWNPSTLYLHRSMELMRGAMALTLSTNQLAREYFPYNPTIYIVPNYLDKNLWDNPTSKKQDGKIRIGWAGGNAHADDLFMISKVLKQIVKEYKGKVIFETMGMTKNELRGVFPLEDFGTCCPKCDYEGEIHHHPGEDLGSYPLVLAGKCWDMAVAPVINNGFGNCKSDIKIKEYSAVNLAIVASNVVPYKEAKENGGQLLLAETYEEWYNSIKELIDNPAKRDEMVRANREWLAKYWIQENAQSIFEIYSQVIAKAELVFGKKPQK